MLRVNKGIVRALELCDGSQVSLAKKIKISKQRLSRIIRCYKETGYCPYRLEEKIKNNFDIPSSYFTKCITFDCEYLTRNVVLSRLIVECN